MSIDTKKENEAVEANQQSTTKTNLRIIEDETNERRIQKWRERYAKNKASYGFVTIDKEGKALDVDDLGKQPNGIYPATVSAATGSACPMYGLQILSATVNACYPTEVDKPALLANAIQNALLALKPQDEIEGHLISRLIVLHNHYIQYMTQARVAEDIRFINHNINCATKLMRLYNETLQTLNKHRRGGEQKVVVQHQHINVHEGGQAVGIHTRGGD